MNKTYADIKHLICYMEIDTKAYFDLFNYKCYYESELQKNDLTIDMRCLIEIPKVNKKDMIISFVKNQNNNKLNNRLKKILDKDKPDIYVYHDFHITIIQFNLYERWTEFSRDYYIKEAIKWCNKNNVIYSL